MSLIKRGRKTSGAYERVFVLFFLCVWVYHAACYYLQRVLINIPFKFPVVVCICSADR